MAKPTTTHPDLELLEAYGRCQLDDDRTAEVEAHVAACDSCCARLQSLPEDRFVALLRASASPPPPITAPDASRGGGETETETVSLQIPSSFAQAGAPPKTGPPPPPEVPAPLADHPRYRVVRWLGSGGMGAVYLAEHRLMGRPVALKVIKRDLTDQEALVERFRREVRAAARLHHPNVITSFDAEQAGAVHFLVMEYVEGTDLARLVKTRGPLPSALACDYARQAALGLQHAHEHSLVHRDIKPQNLMLTPSGQVKILDFGLALLAGEIGPDDAVTASGAMLGTADYIAPEQADDAHTADIRADIYSLGCTLYFLLAAQPPFPGGTLMQKLKAHSGQAPRPLGTIRSDLPRGLQGVLDRTMAKDPARRYQTPAEVARALAPFADASATGPAVAPPTVGGTVDSAAPTLPATPGPHTGAAKKPAVADLAESAPDGYGTAHRPRRPWTPIAVSLAALLIGLGLLGAIYRISTDKGELVIETEEPEINVLIERGGELVTIVDPRTDQTIELRSGDYRVALEGRPAGLQLSADAFTLRRGGREVVRVRRVPPAATGMTRAPRPLSSPDRPAVARLDELDRFTAHGSGLRCVAFSPDGKTLASGGIDGLVKLWDLSRGERRASLGEQSHDLTFFTLAFSADGKWLAAGGSDGIVRLWGPTTGRERGTLRGQSAPIRSVAFSPDSATLITGGQDNSVRLWDVASAEERTARRLPKWIRSMALSPDGKTLAIALFDDGGVRLWDPAEMKPRATAILDSGPVNVMAFSPDGRVLATGGTDRTVRLWDVAAGKVLASFSGHRHAIESIAYSPDGRTVVSGDGDWTNADLPGEMIVWDVASGQEFASKSGDWGVVYGLAFSPDGKTIAAGYHDGSVRLWGLRPPTSPEPSGAPRRPEESFQVVQRFRGHQGRVGDVAFSPDGHLALTADGGTLRLWDVESGQQRRQFDGHTAAVQDVAFTTDARGILSASRDGTVRLWDVESGAEVHRFEGHRGEVWGLALSPDGEQVLTGCDDTVVRLFDVETGRELRRCSGHTGAVKSVAISPDGKRALSGSPDDKTVRLWDLRLGKERRRIDCPDSPRRVTFSPDGRRALGGCLGGLMVLWDLETGREIRRFEGHEGTIYGVAFTPDGRHALSAAGDWTVRLWDVASGQERDQFAEIGENYGLAIGRDGRHVLTNGSWSGVPKLLRLPAFARPAP